MEPNPGGSDDPKHTAVFVGHLSTSAVIYLPLSDPLRLKTAPKCRTTRFTHSRVLLVSRAGCWFGPGCLRVDFLVSVPGLHRVAPQLRPASTSLRVQVKLQPSQLLVEPWRRVLLVWHLASGNASMRARASLFRLYVPFQGCIHKFITLKSQTSHRCRGRQHEVHGKISK